MVPHTFPPVLRTCETEGLPFSSLRPIRPVLCTRGSSITEPQPNIVWRGRECICEALSAWRKGGSSRPQEMVWGIDTPGKRKESGKNMFFPSQESKLQGRLIVYSCLASHLSTIRCLGPLTNRSRATSSLFTWWEWDSPGPSSPSTQTGPEQGFSDGFAPSW